MSKEDYIPRGIGFIKMNSGLENPANVCFANSIIQALSACPNFVFYLIANKNNKHISEKYIEFNNKLLLILLLLNHLNQEKAQKIDEIVNELSESQINFAEQQDSHEFLKLIYDKLSQIEKSKLESKKSLLGFNGNNIFDNWKNPFSGKLMETMFCYTCKDKGVSKITEFCDFTFLINFVQEKTIDQLFTEFFLGENLEGVYCAICSLQQFKSSLSDVDLKKFVIELEDFSISEVRVIEELGFVNRKNYCSNTKKDWNQ